MNFTVESRNLSTFGTRLAMDSKKKASPNDEAYKKFREFSVRPAKFTLLKSLKNRRNAGLSPILLNLYLKESTASNETVEMLPPPVRV